MNWTEELRQLIPTPCHHRPLVCDGLPEESELLVIGLAPATKTSVDWWSWWNPTSGFNFRAFEQHYEDSRIKLGKRPVSNTRKRLNWIREAGIRAVETNVFATEQPSGYGGQSNTTVLELLLTGMPNLKGILVHGAEAARVVKNLNPSVPLFERFNKLDQNKHLIYWGRDDVNWLVGELR